MAIFLNLTWAIVLLPLLGAAATFLAETPRRAAQAVVGFTGLALVVSLVVLAYRLTHTIPTYENVQTFWDLSGASATTARGAVFPADFLLAWGIRVDPLSVAFMTLVLFLSLVAQAHALASARSEEGYRRFFWVSGVLTFGLLALVASPNLFQFLLGWEVVAVAAWMLAAHVWHRGDVAADATRTFVLLRVADAALLLALAFTYSKFAARVAQKVPPIGLSTSDPLSFSSLTPLWHLAHIGDVAGTGPRTLVVLALLLVIAAIIRAGVGPLHVWLTSAVNAPVAGLALVALAAPLSAAILLARVFPLLIEAPAVLSALALVGAVTAVAGAVLALAQRDLFRVGVFAVSSQGGMILAALGMGGFSPALFALFTSSVLTVLFFLAAGNIARGYRTRDVTQLGGTWERMRRSSVGLLVWAVGISGVSLNTYSVLSATLRNAVPLGGSSSRPVQVVVALAVLLTVGLTALFAFRTFLLVAAGQATRRRGFDVARVSEAEPLLSRPVTLLAAGVVVATLVGIPGVSAFSIGGHRVAGLTFSHFVYYGAVRQQLALDLVALALVLIVGLAGLALAWVVYGPRRRTAGERLRSRLARAGVVLAGRTPAERLARWAPAPLLRAGATLEAVDADLLAPIADSPGESLGGIADLLARVRSGDLNGSLAATFAGLALLLAAALLAVTGHFPVATR